MTTARGTRPCDAVGRLTSRQRDVLSKIADGENNPQIALQLGITRDGVKWHVHEILLRLDVETREEAAELWREYHGLPRRLWRAVRAVGIQRWLPWVTAGAGMAAAAIVLTSILGHQPHAGSVPPPSYAGETIHFTVTEYLNPDLRHGIPDSLVHQQAHTTTDEWWSFDSEGSPVHARSEIRSTDGTILQTTVTGKREQLTYPNGPTGQASQACATTSGETTLTQHFPQISAEQLLDLDYKPARSDAQEMAQIEPVEGHTLETFEFTESNEAGPFGLLRTVIDSTANRPRAEFVYLYQSNGSLLLDQSRVFSPIEIVEGDSDMFSISDISDCAGMVGGRQR
jgi:DNA-binding CsgD family transcriptional regulator